MSPIVLAAGSTARGRCRRGTTFTLRGPQRGWRRRIATID